MLLEKRKFNDILDIVNSDIYKHKKATQDFEEDFLKEDEVLDKYNELKYALTEYISYIEIPDLNYDENY